MEPKICFISAISLQLSVYSFWGGESETRVIAVVEGGHG
jgi:hypothetical protein